MQLRNRNHLLTLDYRNVRELFLDIAIVVLQRYVVLQHTGKNFEVGNAAGEGVGHSFEYKDGSGLIISTFTDRGVAVATHRLAGDGVMLAGGGRVVHDEIHQLVDANVAQARGEEYGEEFVFANRFVQRRDQIFFGDRAL